MKYKKYTNVHEVIILINRCSNFDKQIMKYFHIKFGDLDNNLVY